MISRTNILSAGWSSLYRDRWVVLFTTYDDDGLQATSPVGFTFTRRGAERHLWLLRRSMAFVGGPFSVSVERAR